MSSWWKFIAGCGGSSLQALTVLAVFSVLPYAWSEVAETGDTTVPNRLLDTFCRFWSSEIREIDEREFAILAQIAKLPMPEIGHSLKRRGLHSSFLFRKAGQLSIQVDLGKEYRIDAIAMAAAKLEVHGDVKKAYGFPMRFQIEIARQEDFGDAVMVADYVHSDYPNPGSFPYYLELGGKWAQYVRITTYKHWQLQEALAILALGELFVLSGGENVAFGKRVSSTSHLNKPPEWEKANLVDNLSILGLPVSNEKSPTNGYHSLAATSMDVTKWIQVDLKKVGPVDTVWLYPSRPIDWADSPGFGFPKRFRIEASMEPDFLEPILLADHTAEDMENPGDNPFIVNAGGIEAQFIRITATRLHKRAPENYIFALAEVQVFSEGENIARKAEVTALDSFHFESRPWWDPSFLIDGYTSQRRLLGLSEWLRGLDQRRKLSGALDRLRAQRIAIESEIITRSGISVGIVIIVMGVGYMFTIRRRHVLAKRHLNSLREQIANDLHDDIGSNLASIALLSKLASDNVSNDETKEEFEEISQIAQDTANSMRDIVWLINSSDSTMDELVARMRELTASLFGHVKYSFNAFDSFSRVEASLEVKRHLFLFFKESLNNIVKHANASDVQVDLEMVNGDGTLRISDNGCGFTLETVRKGTGLQSLQKRAQRLGGTFRIKSAPGEGTKVELVFGVKLND